MTGNSLEEKKRRTVETKMKLNPCGEAEEKCFIQAQRQEEEK